MNFKEFEKLVKLMEKEEKHTRYTKGKEYSNDDRLILFKELGKELKCSKCGQEIGELAVFWIVFKKHLRAILSYINSNQIYSESIQSRIMDCRVYLTLLRGLIEERNKKCQITKKQK